MSKTIGNKDDNITYAHRNAVRLIIFDDEKKIALLYAKNDNYYKLPGGEWKDDESFIRAAERGAKEDLDCNICSLSRSYFAMVQVRLRPELLHSIDTSL